MKKNIKSQSVPLTTPLELKAEHHNVVLTEEPLAPRKEYITTEELNKIKELQSKAIHATTLAEKAYSEARVADLEANNFTLTIYNKYKLTAGKDAITNDGSIIRAEETV